MASEIARDERSYRRGLVLGFTMAEIFVLVIFCLLLIWMVAARRDETHLRENDTLKRRLAELEEQLAVFVPAPGRNRFDDVFRELRQVQQELAVTKTRAAALEDANAALQRIAAIIHAEGAPPQEIAERSREQLLVGESVIAAAEEAGVASKTGTETQLRRTVASLVEIRRRLVEAGLNEAAAASVVKSCVGRLSEVEGRLRYAERQLQALGRGTEWPACWADSTGRPEYIFDVALTSRSLHVRETVPPDRQEAYKELPVTPIRLNEDLTLAAFREATRPLFEWSEREHCRFFVRVFDTTASSEKSIYKLHLRTVGEHFYYYEELRLPWDARPTVDSN